MFFESHNQCKCKLIKSQERFVSTPGRGGLMISCSRQYCHGEQHERPPTSSPVVLSMTTSQFSTPKPAPRKSLNQSRSASNIVTQSSRIETQTTLTSKRSIDLIRKHFDDRHKQSLAQQQRVLFAKLPKEQHHLMSSQTVPPNPQPKINPGTNQKSLADSPQRTQLVSDRIRESSSEEDTEDSTDNRPEKPKPGRLDLRQFDNITNAIGKLSVQPTIKPTGDLTAAHSKVLSQSSENNSSSSSCSLFPKSKIDSRELVSSRGAAIKQLNEILANKPPPGGRHVGLTSRSSSLDPEQQIAPSPASKKIDKNSKKDKKKLRDDEKLEKRRLKEEEKLRRQEKKLAAKKSKSAPTDATELVGEDGIPFFIKCCIEFIELEGLDAEGIYRVPGNRAHVDAFVQKFKDTPDMSISESDIPVNAVATALKDFLSKKWGPIIPLDSMNELTELANISVKDQRVQAVRNLVQQLPPANYHLLKYVFSHFVKVSLNHSLNSMDSKNLAICWWPTLLPLHFSDMVMFEQMRPHLEESIQTMIDHFEFIFDTDEPTSPATVT